MALEIMCAKANGYEELRQLQITSGFRKENKLDLFFYIVSAVGCGTEVKFGIVIRKVSNK